MNTKLLAVVAAINLAVAGSASAQSESLEEVVVKGHRAYLSDFDYGTRSQCVAFLATLTYLAAF